MFVDCIDDRRRGALAHRADDLIRARSVTYSSSRTGQVREAAVMGTRGSGVFVGREREFADVVQCLDLAGTGQGATVLVTGDAGIGKTRLAAEVASAAGAKGFEVLLGRSIDLVGVELPFQPFVDALRPLGNPFGDGSGVRSCRCSSPRWRCCRSGQRSTRCWSCWRISTGPTSRRSTSSSSWPTTSSTCRWCSWRRVARQSRGRRNAWPG